MDELLLRRVIESLEADQQTCRSKSEGYLAFVAGIGGDCGREIMGIILRYRMMENDIAECVLFLKKELTESPDKE